jgi:MFS family permease
MTAGFAVSRRSRWGLYLANFFLAELIGVLLPLLNDYLADNGWSVRGIGVATAMAGLGLWLVQIPAGIWLDSLRAYRAILMAAALVVGAAFALMPQLLQRPVLLCVALFISGAGQAFIVPLLSTLALLLAGPAGVNNLLGRCLSANHAGNLVASAMVLGLVKAYGTASAFYAIFGIAVLAALSCLLVRREELHPAGSVSTVVQPPTAALSLLREPAVRMLMLTALLYHIANAGITPLVAQYSRQLGARDGFVTELVFAAQAIMIPASILAGSWGDRYGRKTLLTFAFAALPVRIALYAVWTDPNLFLVVALLDGFSFGVFEVLTASVCADLDAGRGRFNALIGMSWSTLALGSVVSPLVGGAAVHQVGFVPVFWGFSVVGVLAALLFWRCMPETGRPASA